MTFSFGKGLRPEVVALLLLDASAALLAALALVGGRAGGRVGAAGWAALLIIPIAVAMMAMLAASGLYQPAAWIRARQLMSRAAVALLLLVPVALGVRALIGAAPSRPAFDMWVILVVFVACAVGLRLTLTVMQRRGFMRPRLALIHSGGAHALRLAPEDLPFPILGVEMLPSELAPEQLRRSGASAAVAVDAEAAQPALRRRCRAAGLDLLSRTEFEEIRQGRVDLDALQPDWMASAAIADESRFAAAWRRAFDIASGLALLVGTLPLLLLTALAIRLEGPGPILYRQERVGQGGRVFTLFKFRSMSVDAERGGPRWAQPGDPRVTRVGRFIRLTRIDEIPQVLNVLRGDMAMIGPRPERPTFVEQLAAIIPHYDDRHAVRPGITGWAQVSYPYGASVEDARNKLAYDLFYLRRRSLGLDVAIVMATVRVILTQQGAR